MTFSSEHVEALCNVSDAINRDTRLSKGDRDRIASALMQIDNMDEPCDVCRNRRVTKLVHDIVSILDEPEYASQMHEAEFLWKSLLMILLTLPDISHRTQRSS